MNLGLFIGRLNPPHIWHTGIIKKSLKQNDKVLVLLCSPLILNENNPFEFEFRKKLLLKVFDENKLKILELKDNKSDLVWIKNIINIINKNYKWIKTIKFYWGDFKNDSAYNIVKQYEKEFEIYSKQYILSPRKKSFINHDWRKYYISSTNLKNALKDGDMILVKKLCDKEIFYKLTNWSMSLPLKQETLSLLEKYSTQTKQHLLQVWAIMEYFAKKLWENEHYWWLVWVLHDIDRDYIEKNWEKHLKEEFERIAWEINLPQEIIWDIKSHWYFLDWIDEKPNTLVRKYLCSVDELSWFIWAYFRMLPSNDVMDIKPKSIKKKLKDKSFAAWVDRNEAKACETLLEIPIDEFIEDIKLALKDWNWQK